MEQTKHFSRKELQCKGCDNAYCMYETPVCNITSTALLKLEVLRDLIGQPLIVLSAARCPNHNEAVGGVFYSQHISTKDEPSCAIDVKIPKGITSRAFLYLGKYSGFTGLGLYDTFVHFDDRPNVTMWDKRKHA